MTRFYYPRYLVYYHAFCQQGIFAIKQAQGGSCIIAVQEAVKISNFSTNGNEKRTLRTNFVVTVVGSCPPIMLVRPSGEEAEHTLSIQTVAHSTWSAASALTKLLFVP